MAMVKICGLKEPELVRIAAGEGADWLGFMFAPSPRRIDFDTAAKLLPFAGSARTVAVFVDPSDDDIHQAATLGFDSLQLHGNETPARVAELSQRAGWDVWKVLKVARPVHLAQARTYTEADGYLIEALPPPDADRAGGHGASFDWSILDGWQPEKLWLLAGGLTPENVGQAIAQTGAPAVDVSSGVERVRGIKDAGLVRAFLRAAKQG